MTGRAQYGGAGMRFLLLLAGLFLLILFLHERFIGPLDAPGAGENLGYALISAALVSFLLSSASWERAAQGLRLTVFWIAVLATLVGLYGYRHELGAFKDRFLAGLMPQMGYQDAPGRMSFFRAANGHFHIEAFINGQPVRFLVDTGATDIVLDPGTARQLGFDPRHLTFDRRFHTANGEVRGAGVRLRELRVGELVLTDLPASVNAAEMRQPLLGMRFFNRLTGYGVSGDVLTIRWGDDGGAHSGGESAQVYEEPIR